VTLETPFCLKSIFLSKRSGQRGNEERIFSIFLIIIKRQMQHKIEVHTVQLFYSASVVVRC
jgi:hypothetical protein